MNVVLDNQPAKYLERLNEPDKSKLKQSLLKLSFEPPQGDIKKLQGQDGYRMRVGNYRVLFDKTDTCIAVYKIAPRGQAYKETK